MGTQWIFTKSTLGATLESWERWGTVGWMKHSWISGQIDPFVQMVPQQQPSKCGCLATRGLVRTLGLSQPRPQNGAFSPVCSTCFPFILTRQLGSKRFDPSRFE